MAQNITLLGASYTAVPAVLLPKTGGGTARFDDASVTTAVEADVASGKTFLLADGSLGTGSASDGSSSWTKIGEASYSVNTTSTSTGTVATMATGHREAWDKTKWVYVRIRDTAGARSGYFYGSDQFFYNLNLANGGTATSITTAMRIYIRHTTGGDFSVTVPSGTSGYGVWADTLYSDGRVRIRRRYNSNYSLTINGTFKVEVFILDPAGGVAPFAE